jgi:ABC-type glutathione transport system ATPase component
MSNLNNQFDQIKTVYNRKLGQLESLRERLATSNAKIVELTDKEDITLKASLFLQSLSDQTRLQVLDKISGIVTEALQTVKDKNLVFTMSLVTKANQPTLEMGILDKLSGQTYDIINSFGGGICDIVSLALRVALLVKWQPNLSRVLVLDEACKHVAIKDQELLSTFVKKLSEALNIQFIWISHSDILQQAAHKIFEVYKYDGLSTAQEKDAETL